MLFQKCHKFRPSTDRGIIAKIEKTLDEHSAFLENIKEGKGIVISKNAQGGIIIESNAKGGNYVAGSFAFTTTATQTDPVNWNDSEIPEYDVSVLGGSAQVLGGTEKIFEDRLLENVLEGSFVYIRYKLWDSVASPICEWDANIDWSLTPPVFETTAPKSLVFCIARIGEAYTNYVNQFRLGSIQAIATLNASPTADGLPGVEI